MKKLIHLNDNGCQYKAYFVGITSQGNILIEYLNGDREEVSILELVTPIKELLN